VKTASHSREVLKESSSVPLAGLYRKAFPFYLIFEVPVMPPRVEYSFDVPFVVKSFAFPWFISNLDWGWGIDTLPWQGIVGVGSK
jgi:hypothetical protein